MPKKWKTLGTKQIFGNRIFGFREDKVLSPKTENTHPVWVMDAPTWVNIIPITKQKKVIMIKQYRFGSQEISLEIPGGMVDEGEDTLSPATREMKELAKCMQADVRPISGNAANTALTLGILRGGDSVIVNSIEQGGHISHNPIGVVGRRIQKQGQSLILGKEKSISNCSNKDREYAKFWDNYYDP